MVNQQLLNYIRQSLQEKNQEQVREELKRVGWQEKDIEEAFVELGLKKKENLWNTGLLFEKSWQLYTSRLKKFLLIRLVVFALFPVWLLFAFLAFLLVNFLGAAAIVLLIVFGLLLFLGSILLVWWVELALFQAIKEEKIIGVKEALRQGWRKFFSYVWLKILIIIITLVIGFLLPFGVFGLILYLLWPLLNTVFLIILAIILFVLALIPGIVLSIWFSLAGFIFVVEGKRGMAALYRSKQLVAGRWWSVVWRLSVIRLVSSLILVPIYLILRQIASIIDSLLIVPFVSSFHFFIYKDLAQLKVEVPFQLPSQKVRTIFTVAVVLGIVVSLVLLVVALLYFIPDLIELIRDFPELRDSEFIPVEEIPDFLELLPQPTESG